MKKFPTSEQLNQRLRRAPLGLGLAASVMVLPACVAIPFIPQQTPSNDCHESSQLGYTYITQTDMNTIAKGDTSAVTPKIIADLKNNSSTIPDVLVVVAGPDAPKHSDLIETDLEAGNVIGQTLGENVYVAVTGNVDAPTGGVTIKTRLRPTC